MQYYSLNLASVKSDDYDLNHCFKRRKVCVFQQLKSICNMEGICVK